METAHEALWALATAGAAARCLHVVAELGVADHIGGAAVPVAELAQACGAAPDPLDRILRLLVAHGVFASTTVGYRHTAASDLLRSGHPASMRPFAQMMGLPLVWQALAALEGSARTGRTGVETFEPKGMWSYLRDRPVEADVFARAMTAKAGADVAAVTGAYDFRRFDTIADIGGGRGHLLRAVLDRAPDAAGILFDLPEVVAALDVGHPRLTAMPGDFFVDALPDADAYLLMEVLHDWTDDENVAILAAIRRAAQAGATLLVVEDLLDSGQPDLHAGTLDVIMLAVTGGRQRSPAKLGALLHRAGFALQRVLPTTGPMHVLEARAE